MHIIRQQISPGIPLPFLQTVVWKCKCLTHTQIRVRSTDGQTASVHALATPVNERCYKYINLLDLQNTGMQSFPPYQLAYLDWVLVYQPTTT